MKTREFRRGYKVIMHSIRILLPMPPNDLKDIFFKGYVITTESDLTTLFITKYYSANDMLSENKKDKDGNILYGFSTEGGNKQIMFKKRHRNYLIMNNKENIELYKLVIHGIKINIEASKIIIILYNHEKILKSETINVTDDYFYKLQLLVHQDCKVPTHSTSYTPLYKNPPWLWSSMFSQHIHNYLNMLAWLVSVVRRKEKISMIHGNLFFAILIDIALGYLILQSLMIDKKDLGSLLLGMLERLVNLMYSLLKWLMGAPAGLKLNNAFNKMLGKYFSYHVELWWLFLDVTSEKLYVILHIYHCLGYLGLTFQAAMISDLICLATFHSYCIYVYAARLFNIQMSGLTALLRLFFGRKYNPLRGGIDSCEYTNQELFVGTVAFTILLLLLPTTLMYYIVFTMFRLLSLLVQYILARLIYLVHTLPLYVVSLWLLHSPKVAGNITVEVISSIEVSPLILRVKLFKKSLKDLINFSKPPIEVSKQVEWTSVLSNVFTGKQII